MKREYRCPKCGERKELERKEAPFCNLCKMQMEWAPTKMSFALKGKGWTPKGN